MAIRLKLTQQQRRNLRRLADFLEALPPQEAEKKFSMAQFFNVRWQATASGVPGAATYRADLGVEHPCGTVACAVGWGPAAGIAPQTNEEWGRYSERVFGASHCSFDSPKELFFDWCFGIHWKNTDDTATGAAARIRWFLAHGVPDDWHHQMLGTAPLCYSVKV